MRRAPTYARIRNYDQDERTMMGRKGVGITVMAETWNGKVEVDLLDNGEFTVYLGPKKEKGSAIITGNVGDTDETRNPQGKRFYRIGRADLDIAEANMGIVEVS